MMPRFPESISLEDKLALRVGDIVTVHFTHAGSSDRRSEPFDVEIARIQQRPYELHRNDDGDVIRYAPAVPLIQWRWASMPVELQPPESVRDDFEGLDACSADWIVAVVRRAPYQIAAPVAPNAMWRGEQQLLDRARRLNAFHASRGQVDWARPPENDLLYWSVDNRWRRDRTPPGEFEGQVFKLAEELVSLQPELAVRWDLSVARFFQAWRAAGMPGRVYAGPHRWVEALDDREVSPPGMALTEYVKARVRRKTFRRWVLRNVGRFTTTEAEMQERARRGADVEHGLDHSFYEDSVRDSLSEFVFKPEPEPEPAYDDAGYDVDAWADDY